MKSKNLRNQAAKMLTCCILLIVFIENSIASPYNDGMSNELGSIHEEIGLLRNENKNQNMEIGLLKERLESQDKTIHKTIIEQLNNLIKGGADHHSIPSGNKVQRSKRPASFLTLFDDRSNDKSEKGGKTTKLPEFFGPPTSCSDLSLLGYTLNGYYLVESDAAEKEVSINNPDTVYCAFKQPGHFNPFTVEKRIGRMEIIGGSNNKSNSSKEIAIGSTERSVTPRTTSAPPRRANLINLLGKCVAISDDSNINGRPLIQNSCISSQKGMQWSWNETSLGSRTRHLCNGHGKCAASRRNSRLTHASLVQWDHLYDQEGQKFHFIESASHPGYYLIKNDFGQCLSVPKNVKNNHQEINVSDDCNDKMEGQLWKWKTY